MHLLVWFGDAPGHDPICPAIVGDGTVITSDITEATTTAALDGANIIVVPISTPQSGFPDGLNDDPTMGTIDYHADCGTPVGGTAGQATNIATATRGFHTVALNDALVDTIVNVIIIVTTPDGCVIDEVRAYVQIT